MVQNYGKKSIFLVFGEQKVKVGALFCSKNRIFAT